MTAVAVAACGALGVLARWALGSTFTGAGFPYVTLAVNVAGCAALGALVGAPEGRLPAVLVTALGTGFLGGFTTFSTFGVETQSLLRAGRTAAAAAYVGLSVAGGVAAAAAAWSLTLRVAR